MALWFIYDNTGYIVHNDPSRHQQRVPRTVWTFWFGNPLAGARLESFKALCAGIGAETVLVNDSNLRDFEHPGFPYHPALSFLSRDDKVDYLRAYFMHFYGGGYHDIEEHKPEYSWEVSFSLFQKDASLRVLGSALHGKGYVGCDETYAQLVLGDTYDGCLVSKNLSLVDVQNIKATCCDIVFHAWRGLVHNGSYIMRPMTPFTRV